MVYFDLVVVTNRDLEQPFGEVSDHIYIHVLLQVRMKYFQGIKYNQDESRELRGICVSQWSKNRSSYDSST